MERKFIHNYTRTQEEIEIKEKLLLLNNKWAYVQQEHKVVILGTQQLYTIAQLKNMESETILPNTKKKSFTCWLEWQHRNIIEKLTYKPGERPLAIIGNEYNMWAGWGVIRQSNWTHPKQFYRLIDYFFQGYDYENQKHFFNWLAYPLQNPKTPKNISIYIFYSRYSGVGFSALTEIIKKIYGKSYNVVDNKKLVSNFNDWLVNKNFVAFENLVASKESRQELRYLAASKQISVNKPHKSMFEIDNNINFMVTSNNINIIEPNRKDRCFNFIEVKNPPLSDEFYNDYYKELNENMLAESVFEYLLDRDLTKFNPYSPAPGNENVGASNNV